MFLLTTSLRAKLAKRGNLGLSEIASSYVLAMTAEAIK